MIGYDMEREVLNSVRQMNEFPFRTGHLKWDATYSLSRIDGFDIVFDTRIAHYINFLEYGTKPHLISNAFGREVSVMHPGSRKHVGFIKNKAVNAAIQRICILTGGKEII